jgi:hypothetical protein
MPTEVKGVLALRKALNAYAPDLAKELTAEITKSLKVIQKDARGFVPDKAPNNLYNWNENAGGKITARSSMFRTFNTEGRVRMFPLYDATTIKRGIVYRTGYGKPNARGFRSLFRVKNMSAAGAIYETAGRKNNNGDDKTKRTSSDGRGARFVQQGPIFGRKKEGQDMRGRLLFRAWEQDQGKQMVAIFKAIDKTSEMFKKRTSIVDVKRSA